MKKGSAFITVLAALVTLVLLVVGFISSSRNKTGLTKMMSDEKKAEALAESATDLVLSYIKKNANNHEAIKAEQIYYLLRAPLKKSNTGDSILDVSTSKPIEDLKDMVGYEAILKDSIKEIGWTDKVEITSTCEICNAEFFTPANSAYKVNTIDNPHLPSWGNSAKFYDDESTCSETTSDWIPSNWELRLKFPSGKPTKESVEFEIGVSGIGLFEIDYDVELTVERQSERDLVLELFIDSSLKSKQLDPVDVQKKMDDSHYFPDIRPATMQGLKEYCLGDQNPSYYFSSYLSLMKDRKSEVNPKYSAYNNSFSMDGATWDNPYYIEKGAILRITTKVEYKPNDSSSLKRTLVAEIPFKVSDVQPIAPEYSFFVANTPKVGDAATGRTLGEPLAMNDIGGSTSTEDKLNRNAIGWFIIHNLPFNDSKPDFNSFSDGRIPGMVRVNTDYNGTRSDDVTKIRSFLGTFEEPELTELNKFFTPFNEDFTVNKFNTRVSFMWEKTSETAATKPQRYHEVEFPVLFETKKKDYKIEEEGIKGFIDVYKRGNFDIVSVPTLLFGNSHMEYPLGLCVEGPIDSVFGRIRVSCLPDAKYTVVSSDIDDRTKVFFNYENVSTYSNDKPYDFSTSAGTGNDRSQYDPAPYGMVNHPGYSVFKKWASNSDFQYCPANCYDALQYAKKATKFYETSSEFLNDLKTPVEKGGFKGKSSLELNGVFYIKSGDLNLSGLTYKGNALIVSKNGVITINGDVKRADNESTLGIIARGAYIEFNASLVQASCFSNYPPCCISKSLKIEGNLVCNDFIRAKFVKAEVFYDNRITTVTPFASLRKVGKFEPKRYIAAFADNWSKFVYEKNK